MFAFSRTHVASLCVAALLGGSAQADIISLANNSNVQGRINGNDFSKPGGISEGRTIRAGTTGANAEFRGFMVYDTSSFAGPVTSATLTFEIQLGAGLTNIDVYGVSTSEGFDGSIDTLAERTALFNSPESSAVLLDTLLISGLSNNDVINVDATSFVSDERGSSNNIVGFLFVESDPSLDGTANLFQIYDSNDPSVQNPQLELVPEPSSFALLGLGGLLIARRRRG